MPFSLEHKCLFVHIPRTGGSSFRKALGVKEPTEDTPAQDLNGDFTLQPLTEKDLPTFVQLHHLCMKQIQMIGVLEPSLLNESFKCAFVRNPWDKVASKYFHNYQHHSDSFEDFIVKVEKIVAFVNENFVFDIESAFYKKYSDLIISTLTESMHNKTLNPWRHKAIWIDPHFFPQHFFIYDELGNILIDFVGRFENYNKDAHHILSHLGASRLYQTRAGVLKPLPIPHLNYSTRLDYREMYNLKTKDIVYNLFKKDIQTFDYRF